MAKKATKKSAKKKAEKKSVAKKAPAKKVAKLLKLGAKVAMTVRKELREAGPSAVLSENAQRIHDALSEARSLMESLSVEPYGGSNLRYVDYLPELVDGKETGNHAIVFLVRKKPSESAKVGPAAIPSEIQGIPTDIQELGEVAEDTSPHAGEFILPTLNSSKGGTIACVLKTRFSTKAFVLSNRHTVIPEGTTPRQGTDVFGCARNGTGRMNIGTLAHWSALQQNGNLHDAAITKTSNGLIDPAFAIPGGFLIDPANVAQPVPGMRVKKIGAKAARVKTGQITDISYSFTINRKGRNYGFAQQVVVYGDTSDFQVPGDSGALLVTESDNQPVGLLFSRSPGNGRIAYANRMTTIRDDFRIKEFLNDAADVP